MELLETKSISEPDALLNKIHVEFPDLTWKTYTHVTDGWDHEVIILDDRLVFRFPNDNQYATLLKTEVEVLSKLQSIVQSNIPNYSYIAKDCSFAGYPIVPGEILTKANFDKLNENTVHIMARQMASLLSSLHTAQDKKLNLKDVPLSYMPKDQIEIRELASKYLPTTLSSEDYQKVQVILADVDDILVTPGPISFIHGDVYSNHLLWDDRAQKLGIIDFSDMSIADPAIDFAELYEYGQSFLEEVYEYYTAPKDDTFLSRAWTYQCWVAVYMMTDHFVYHKTSFEVARKTFDRVKLTH
jgi:aminoglycoside phosphotransferase (APT) family kinase protein